MKLAARVTRRGTRTGKNSEWTTYVSVTKRCGQGAFALSRLLRPFQVLGEAIGPVSGPLVLGAALANTTREAFQCDQ